MNWVKRLAIVTVMTGLVSACAVSPKTDEATLTASEAEQQKVQARLLEEFRTAVTSMEEGNVEEATERFEQLAKQHPGHTGPLANLGILALGAGNPDLASKYFSAVLDLDPSHTVALNHLGVLARTAGEFEQAERFYRRALEADPAYLPAMLNLAFLLDIYLGRPDEALSLYEQYQTLASDPNPRLQDWIFDAKNRI